MKLINALTGPAVVILAFASLPGAAAVSEILYEPRIFIVILLTIVGLLALMMSYSSGHSIIAALKTNPPRLSPIWAAVAMYILSISISSWVSFMPGYAWMGSPRLQFGSIIISCCILMTWIFSRSNVNRYILVTLSVTTFIMFAITAIEAVGFRPLEGWLHSGTMSYPASFIGHRQHLAGWYSIMALAPAFFYRRRRKDLWFWLWLVSGIAGVSLCTTSSATLGVGIGLLAWLLTSIRSRSWTTPFLTTLLFALSVLALPQTAQVLSTHLGLQSSNFKDYRSSASIKTRFYLWKAAINSTLERPFFGWGDETFAFQVFEHLDKEDSDNLFRGELGLSKDYNIVSKGFTYYVFNDRNGDKQTGSLIYLRPHGVIFDELYSHGLIGFLLLCAVVFLVLRRICRVDRDSYPLFLSSILPYPIYMLAWFYVPTVTPMFFILLGLFIADLRKIERELPQLKGIDCEGKAGFYSP